MRFIISAFALTLPALAIAGPLHLFQSVVMAPDGQHVASVEGPEQTGDAPAPTVLAIRSLSGAVVKVEVPACSGDCRMPPPAWSPDSRQLAFIVPHDASGSEIDVVPVGGGTPHILLQFAGTLSAVSFARDGRLAVLATENAQKPVGREQAGAAMTGEIDHQIDEQRIAVVEGARLRFISPPNLYVYEFDSRPDGGFVGTAVTGDGDSRWWIAQLYAFDADGATRVLFKPSPREQLAMPVVAPDGRSMAFIGGWMSDFGSFGGDAFLLRLDQPNASPVNLTQHWKATVTGLDWQCADGLTGVTLSGDKMNLVPLGRGTAAQPLWSAAVTLSATPLRPVSCGGKAVASTLSSFTAPPEIYAGPFGRWARVTHENAKVPSSMTARSITWRDGTVDVQGWLLAPAGDTGSPRPLIVVVHGGPQAAATSAFPLGDSHLYALLNQGWRVLLPNYRGSFGQGEAFAAGSIQDIGGGEWRDVLAGLDAAERAVPVDPKRVGIMGASWGGYMTLWAVTQTHRFRAAFSHAGVSDFLSMEGEAPEVGSDQVTFGGSVYRNPAPYLKSSPIMHMTGVNTPTLITVGERDLECPMAQSQEFDTALRALGVPESFVIYAGEGHHFTKQADRDDERRRMVAWFRTWFGEK